MQTSVKKPIPLIGIFIFSWVLFAASYIFLKNNALTYNHASWILPCASLTLEVVVLIYLFKMLRNAISDSKTIFFYFTLSYLFNYALTIIYQLAYNVFHVSHANYNVLLISSYNIPYLGLLVFQCLGWTAILLKSRYKQQKLLLYVPLFIIAVTLFFVFFLIFKLQISGSENFLINFYTAADGIFEYAGFVTALLCLAISKEKGLFYLACGYLIFTAAELIMNFNLFNQRFDVGSFFETFWSLCYLFWIYGLWLMQKNSTYNKPIKTWVYEFDSIKVQTAFWIFAISILAISSYLGLHFLVSSSVFF